MKNHLKRISTPRTWSLKRKAEKFIVRPHAGGHSLEFGMAIGMVLRDKLGLVQSLKEAQKMLHSQTVLVDNKRKKDRRDMVGLFDIISIPALSKFYQITLTNKGKLEVVEITEKDAAVKTAKVLGKSMISGGKIQLRLHDGKTVLFDGDVKVGDSVQFDIAQRKVKSVLPKKNGAKVFLTQGKHAGSTGVLKAIEGDLARYTSAENKEDVETATRYLFVVAWDYN